MWYAEGEVQEVRKLEWQGEKTKYTENPEELERNLIPESKVIGANTEVNAFPFPEICELQLSSEEELEAWLRVRITVCNACH